MNTLQFHGDWAVEVFFKEAFFDQRFAIVGSDTSDGVYPGVPGSPPVNVTGTTWNISLEWNDNATSGWQPSDVRRNAVDYTVSDGLVVMIGADDNYEQFRDHDFNDIVLRCRNTDQRLAPWHPIANPYDFTLPERVRDRERIPPPKDPPLRPPHKPVPKLPRLPEPDNPTPRDDTPEPRQDRPKPRPR
jgi:hypothetical protein